MSACLRRFAVLAAMALAGSFLFFRAVEAAAPQTTTPNPGFYRMMVGNFEVTALSDGTQPLAADKLLVNIPPEDIKTALAAAYLESPVENSDNAYLVNTGQKLILIDAGSGRLLGPARGQLRANLIAAGYRPEQVDEVYLTHLHPDHVGGLVDGEVLAFPNAIVRVDQKDVDYWLSQENMDKAPEQYKRFFTGAQASLQPYIQAGRVKAFEGNTDLAPGLRAVASPGHTPGHSVFVAESRGQKIVFWGDLVHVVAVQFGVPSVGIAFDSDVGAAAAQRQIALSDAAIGGYIVAGAHIAFPGAGRVRRAGKGYEWMPVNYYAVPRAAPVRVLSTTSAREALAEIVPMFERATGRSVRVSFLPGSEIADSIARGPDADLLVAPSEFSAPLLAGGHLAAGSRVDFARSVTAVAARAGTKKPDIASAAGFKQALLDAKSIAYSRGASGLQFIQVAERLGIADAVKSKAVLAPPLELVGAIVARGDADIGIQQVSELLRVPGIAIVGPLPAPLRQDIVYGVSALPGAGDAQAASAFAAFLRSPAVAPVLKKYGLEPL